MRAAQPGQGTFSPAYFQSHWICWPQDGQLNFSSFIALVAWTVCNRSNMDSNPELCKYPGRTAMQTQLPPSYKARTCPRTPNQSTACRKKIGTATAATC